MKHISKLAALLLALALVLTLATPALAAMEGELTGGSITISNAVPGQSYSIYQILYLESYNATVGQEAYAYKANSAWSTFINSDAIKGVYLNVDTQGYVTWVKDADPAAFAKLAQAEAAKMTADGTAVCAENSTTVSFTGLKLGYYLVDTTLGTLCSLDTTNPSATMREKNEAPKLEKQVQEDSTGAWGDKNDADIGQTVNFQGVITAQAGAENYVFHDVMSVGLTFDSVTEITLNNNTVPTTNYSVVKTGLDDGPTDGCTFEVRFTQAFCDTLKANDEIVISYTATVNENAVVGGNGNTNSSTLVYGDKNHPTSTPPDTTITYTWSFDILKYGNDNKENVLNGAKFVLLSKDKSKVATVVGSKLTGWVAVPEKDADGTIAWPENTQMETDSNGKIKIEGLDADTYYLRETKQPAGYNILTEDKEVVINPTESSDGLSLTVEINNQSGTELPSTGGMGTTIFYVVGSILLVGAAVLLIVKKRVSAAD